ncbi:MAG: AAA family ATPase [Barrevirus sp.]|uniref:AAA family ATPase n=1 Tax=Barrevirus sp. TaxID=2487763 RepID=A0A3G4ZS60_9VIRU|nr:MAG: AAA family ATPase [Barrevirus sp.]
MITLESLISGQFNINIIYYYLLYQICQLLYSYLLQVIVYLQIYFQPLFVQSFYLDSKGNTNIYDYLEYIYKTNSGRLYKDYTKHKKNNKSFTDSLSPGTYIITFAGKLVFTKYTLEKDKYGQVERYLTMWLLSFDNNFFNNFAKTVKGQVKKECSLYIKQAESRIYNHDGKIYGLWHKVGPIPKRLLRDTIISDTVLNTLIKIFESFCQKPAYYEQFNIPYKLCLLFSGLPGFGKTSVIKSLANEYGYNLYSMSLRTVTDDLLPHIFLSIKKRSILLFEEVDCMTSRQKNIVKTTEEGEEEIKDNEFGLDGKKEKNNSLSLSAFLNALDGILVCEGLIVIMTTNHPEELDPALIRQERVHLHCRLEKSVEVYCKMFKRFFPNIANDSVDTFANTCFEKDLSLADVQAHCVKHLDNVEKALVI